MEGIRIPGTREEVALQFKLERAAKSAFGLDGVQRRSILTIHDGPGEQRRTLLIVQGEPGGEKVIVLERGERCLLRAAVGGVEYSIFGMFDGPVDLGLLAEYLADGRDPEEAPFTPFEDDYFLAARLALNDEQSTSLLAGAIVDREDGAARK